MPVSIRWTAIAETIALLFGLMAVAWLVGNETRFADISPHPFWIVVLLMAVYYGAAEGLFAATAATAVLFIGNVPVQFYGETFSAWLLRITMEPALWYVAAITLGSRADTQRSKLSDQAEAIRRYDEKLKVIHAAFDDASEANRQLEQTLAGASRTVSTVFEATALLRDRSKAFSRDEAMRFLQQLMGGGTFELYLLDGESRLVDAAEGIEIESDDALYKVAFEQGRFVRVWDPTDRLVLNGRGAMAGPLRGSAGEPVGLVVARDVDLARANTAAFYDFQAACGWLGERFGIAGEGAADLHSPRQMESDLDLLAGLAERFALPISTAYFHLGAGTTSRKAGRFAAALSSINLDVELWYVFPDDGWDFVLLLPGENESTSRVVCEKLRATLDGSAAEAPVTYRIEPLFDQPRPLKVVANDR